MSSCTRTCDANDVCYTAARSRCCSCAAQRRVFARQRGERPACRLRRRSPQLDRRTRQRAIRRRRRAEEELTRLGPDAFDQLKLAEQSTDLEVAERASYIVSGCGSSGFGPKTPPRSAARSARYGDLSSERQADRDSDARGAAGRRRLAGPVPHRALGTYRRGVARRAALALLDQKLPRREGRRAGEACRQELEPSDAAAVAWIELWLREQSDPAGDARRLEQGDRRRS